MTLTKPQILANPRVLLIVRTLYYLGILFALMALAGRDLDAAKFVYQAF